MIIVELYITKDNFQIYIFLNQTYDMLVDLGTSITATQYKV